MSKFDVKASLGPNGKQVSITVKGKLTDAEWEAFKECLLGCVKRYGAKLKVTSKGKR